MLVGEENSAGRDDRRSCHDDSEISIFPTRVIAFREYVNSDRQRAEPRLQ